MRATLEGRPGSSQETEETPAMKLVNRLLDEQQLMTPVARFARKHDHERPALEDHYRELIPLSKPEAGEQYAFEVDLDKCTGCKACVSACHSLNGLEENESWRDVGLLSGTSTAGTPFVQTVTTACHHCADPGCANGCPVLAYEKDAVTGVVRHLDDQCIGCQYCMMKCPFDVPKFSARLGIVRKCDMCYNRLAVGEAPACVQACPTGAIRITKVMKAEVAKRTEFLPGSPAPEITKPATIYKSARSIPRDLRPGDDRKLKPEHAHLPLVAMLLFTQLAVGLFGWDFFTSGGTKLGVLCACASLFAGLAASVAHLGRPLRAWRAFLGWRKSWMSREVIAFGMFAKIALLYAATFFVPVLEPVRTFAAVATLAIGGAGLVCSIMIYHDTQRPFWNWLPSGVKFWGTAIVLGGVAAGSLGLPVVKPVIMSVAILKLCYELYALLPALHAEWSPAKKSALLMLGPLRSLTVLRLATTLASLALVATGIWLWALAVRFLSEFAERTLFFQAVAAPKMPGGMDA